MEITNGINLSGSGNCSTVTGNTNIIISSIRFNRSLGSTDISGEIGVENNVTGTTSINFDNQD